MAKRAGMLIFWALVGTMLLPLSVEASREEGRKEREAVPAAPVVAMEAAQARPVRAGDLLTAGADPMALVARGNERIEISPHSVAELDEESSFRLLRGSALVESRQESALRTAGARVDFVGKVLVSYDHLERSSSVFVLDGEARLANPSRADGTVRLKRFRGATLVVGDVLPHLVRQLDVGAVRSWLKGYSWPEARAQAFLKDIPGGSLAARQEVPEHLDGVKLEDYFSSIEAADEAHQPDYYQRKFDDPDKVVAEQNAAHGAGRLLSPEEAALLSVPQAADAPAFELGPEALTSREKSLELRGIGGAKPMRRAPAAASFVKTEARRKKAVAVAPAGDPDVSLVLERLRQAHGGRPTTPLGGGPYREPASEAPVVPDPVYDYSQNF